MVLLKSSEPWYSNPQVLNQWIPPADRVGEKHVLEDRAGGGKNGTCSPFLVLRTKTHYENDYFGGIINKTKGLEGVWTINWYTLFKDFFPVEVFHFCFQKPNKHPMIYNNM